MTLLFFDSKIYVKTYINNLKKGSLKTHTGKSTDFLRMQSVLLFVRAQKVPESVVFTIQTVRKTLTADHVPFPRNLQKSPRKECVCYTFFQNSGSSDSFFKLSKNVSMSYLKMVCHLSGTNSIVRQILPGCHKFFFSKVHIKEDI